MIPQSYFEKIRDYFEGDTQKTWTWFATPNPSLGGVSPMDMIKRGRVDKLKKFIDNALDENRRFYP